MARAEAARGEDEWVGGGREETRSVDLENQDGREASRGDEE
jgi:hypothetical protein